VAVKLNSKLAIQYMCLFVHLAETMVETTMSMLQEAERLKIIKLKFKQTVRHKYTFF